MMKSYFRRVLGDRRIMLGKSDGGWYITCKRVVDGNEQPQVLQEIKQRNGKSIKTTIIHLSDKSMDELFVLYEKHPSRLKSLVWKLKHLVGKPE